MADVQFFMADAQFYAAGLLSPWKLCICVEELSMCRHSNEGNPLTEHVQSVYWACARNNNEGKSSDDPVFDSFD